MPVGWRERVVRQLKRRRRSPLAPSNSATAIHVRFRMRQNHGAHGAHGGRQVSHVPFRVFGDSVVPCLCNLDLVRMFGAFRGSVFR